MARSAPCGSSIDCAYGCPGCPEAKAVIRGDLATAIAAETEKKILRAPVTDFSGLVDGTGYKASMDDPRKVPLWLVPVALLMACGRALAHGAKKYAANNWRKGMAYSEVYSALQRHLNAWLEGEDNDPDSGLSHLDHAAACLAFLSEYVAHPRLYSRFDDRFKRPNPEA